MRRLALANDFRWFVTLTLAPDKVDRYDAGEVVRKLSQWCNNQVKRRGLKYVLVPERHKDGALHFLCCASLLRAARRDGLAMDAGCLMDAWARWRGLDAAALDLVKLELVLHYHGDLQAPWAEGIIDELGVIW